MFRISRVLDDLLAGKESPKIDMKIAIWNLTKRCNLQCEHCYSSAIIKDTDFWTLEKIDEVAKDLNKNGFRFVILSGGEPLLRDDIFEIAELLRSYKIQTYLSTNGTTIDEKNIQKIAQTFNYIGISIDGDEATHDKFRGKKGSYQRSLSAILSLNALGKKTGLRFTITKNTLQSLPFIYELAEKNNIQKLYLSHLVYAGYGLINKESDISHSDKRSVIGELVDRHLRGVSDIDIVTGNSEQDAVFLMQYFEENYPEKADLLRRNLARWGGNLAGVKLANITPNGDVKPDPFFPMAMGNVTESSFDQIWNAKNEITENLRIHPRKLGGKCGKCRYIDICNGGSRVRAYHTVGDLFGEDPACFIADVARR